MEPRRARRLLSKALTWMALLGGGFGVYAAYRWAEPSPGAVAALRSVSGESVTIRLEDAPFAGYSEGHKTWSVWAKRIDLERLPGATLSNVQTASLTDIRNGALYSPPSQTASTRPASLENSSAKPAASSQNAPVATFRAGQGRYSLSGADPLPFELAYNYLALWQFKLTENVDFKTRAGDRLQSNSLAILELLNRRNGRKEQRVFCDAGATITHEGVRLQANKARYDPASRSVECLGGVRGAFPEGAVQSERMFWSLGEQVLRCPDTASGVLRGASFSAEGLTVDLKRRALQANHVRVQFRRKEAGGALALP